MNEGMNERVEHIPYPIDHGGRSFILAAFSQTLDLGAIMSHQYIGVPGSNDTPLYGGCMDVYIVWRGLRISPGSSLVSHYY